MQRVNTSTYRLLMSSHYLNNFKFLCNFLNLFSSLWGGDTQNQEESWIWDHDFSLVGDSDWRKGIFALLIDFILILLPPISLSLPLSGSAIHPFYLKLKHFAVCLSEKSSERQSLLSESSFYVDIKSTLILLHGMYLSVLIYYFDLCAAHSKLSVTITSRWLNKTVRTSTFFKITLANIQ